MHEASIARSIADSAQEISKNENIYKIEIIYLSIGRIHHIVNEVLIDIFDIIKDEYEVLKKSIIKIETKDIKIKCKKCESTSVLNEPFFLCPSCSSTDIKLIQGDELHIIRIQGIKD